jgi:hypothetical protein
MTDSAPAGDPAGTAGQDRHARNTSIFRRGELPVAHTVYGLILTLATVGELIHHELSAAASTPWPAPGSSPSPRCASMASHTTAHCRGWP